jgi:nicotinamide-nucleotide amidase
MNSSLQSAVRYIDENELKLVTAESCTAGLIASTLSEIPGCGKWLECAFVTYSEDSKLRHLHVHPETIARYNLTSEEVAREMAEGALRLCQANVAIADTGLAGPSGGDGGVPVGTVCFAWAFEHEGKTATYAETRHFEGDRNAVRAAASDYAIARVQHFHQRFRKEWKPGLALAGQDDAQAESQRTF